MSAPPVPSPLRPARLVMVQASRMQPAVTQLIGGFGAHEHFVVELTPDECVTLIRLLQDLS
jgi:hypothetical protein